MSNVHRYNAITLKKLGRLGPSKRKHHLKSWSSTAFKDIKNICTAVCKTKEKIPKKTLNKLTPHKKLIRKISTSRPQSVKNILLKQKGGAIFTALAAGLIPLIIDQVVRAVT